MSNSSEFYQGLTLSRKIQRREKPNLRGYGILIHGTWFLLPTQLRKAKTAAELVHHFLGLLLIIELWMLDVFLNFNLKLQFVLKPVSPSFGFSLRYINCHQLILVQATLSGPLSTATLSGWTSRTLSSTLSSRTGAPTGTGESSMTWRRIPMRPTTSTGWISGMTPRKCSGKYCMGDGMNTTKVPIDIDCPCHPFILDHKIIHKDHQ